MKKFPYVMIIIKYNIARSEKVAVCNDHLEVITKEEREKVAVCNDHHEVIRKEEREKVAVCNDHHEVIP